MAEQCDRRRGRQVTLAFGTLVLVLGLAVSWTASRPHGESGGGPDGGRPAAQSPDGLAASNWYDPLGWSNTATADLSDDTIPERTALSLAIESWAVATPGPGGACGAAGAPSGLDTVQLDEPLVRALLVRTGWPREHIEDALEVAWGESRWSPAAQNGCYVGLFQLDLETWFTWCGTEAGRWWDPEVNAATALCAFRYDEARGQAPWTQWGVKPIGLGAATLAAGEEPPAAEE